MRRLIAGPWCGEFGWELMSWQGRIRELSRSYDETIVCSDDGHQALYADFAKLDLRMAKVLEISNHPNADKLYVLKVDLGGGQTLGLDLGDAEI